MKIESRDINTFSIGANVSIVGVDDYENITIIRISDSGVTVNGPKCAPNTVISGRSPAILYIKQEKIMNETNETNKENIQPPIVIDESNRAKRGSIKAKMVNLTTPNGSFTIKQFAELNGIPTPYANKWVLENCSQSGNVEKKEGQRGRVAALYKKN